jgi:hypothetical protein
MNKWQIIPYALIAGTLLGFLFTLQLNIFAHVMKIEQQLNDQTYLIEAQYKTIREQGRQLDEALSVTKAFEFKPRTFEVELPKIEMPKELL